MQVDPLVTQSAPLSRLRLSGPLAQSIIVFIATMTLSVCGFIFHAIASRKLGVADYGALYALVALYMIAAMPAGLFTPVIAKYSAEFRALHDDAHVRGLTLKIVWAFGVVGALYIFIGIVFKSSLAAFLHVATWQIPVVGLMVAVGLFAGALRAVGLGTHDFASYALSLAGEGIGKVGSIAIFSIAGLTVLRGITGFLIGILFGVAIMALPLLHRYGRIRSATIVLDWPRIWATTAGAASLTITVALIGSADVLLVKHFFNAGDAGLYSAASLGGKILLYFVSFVPTILVPHATDRHARGEKTRMTIGYAMLFIAIAGVTGIFAYHTFGALILHALVGRAFDGALPLLVGYGAAMTLLAGTSALASYGIATHRLAFAVPLLVGAVGTLLVIAFAHATLLGVVTELIAGNVVMLLVVAAAVSWQGARSLVR